MPPPPLVESPRRQRQLVAVLMCLVFLGSIGVAHLFSQARLASRQVHFKRIEVGRLQLQVPDAWERDSAAEAATPLPGQHIYRNPDRPHQVLRVLPVRAAQPVATADVLSHVRRGLLTREELNAFRPLAVQVPSPGSTLQLVDVAGISQLGPNPEDIRIHLTAAMTVDGIEHWVLHLADRPNAEEAPGQVLEQNALLFRRLERFAAVGPGDEAEAPDAGDAGDASEEGGSATRGEPAAEQSGTEGEPAQPG